jgi:hypothetical protein
MATTSIEAITSTAAAGLAIGRNGATNPVLQADCSVSSAATGIKVIGRAATAGADIVVQSSGTNEPLKIDAKGSGAIDIGTTSTGAIGLKRNTAVTGTLGVSSDVAVNTDKFTVAASSGNTLVAGTLAVTGNMAVNTDKFTVAAASGNTLVAGTLAVTGAATLSSTLAVTGNVAVNTDKFTVTASNGNTLVAGTLAVTGALTGSSSIKSAHATAGIGYATGAGGAVTQGTNRTTTVVCDKASGAITLVSAAGSATPFSFTVTCAAVAATDVVVVSQKSGTDKYILEVTAVGAGSFQITAYTTGGTTTEQPVFNFAVIKAVAA